MTTSYLALPPSTRNRDPDLSPVPPLTFRTPPISVSATLSANDRGPVSLGTEPQSDGCFLAKKVRRRSKRTPRLLSQKDKTGAAEHRRR
jgi:hypothetical protein